MKSLNSDLRGGRQLAALLALVAAVMICGCESTSKPDSQPSTEWPPGSFDSAHYDEVRFKQLHNSYQRRVPFETQLAWNESDPSNCGSSSLEIDLCIDPEKYLDGIWDWGVAHVHFEPGEENRFASYLNRLKSWSDANAGHRIVTVQIDIKDTPDAHIFELGGGMEQYLANMPSEVDAYIARHFDTSRMLKPADIIESPLDLVQSVTANGWPTLGELRGKFVFMFNQFDPPGGENWDPRVYCGTTPEDRLMFPMGHYSDAFDGSSIATSGDFIFLHKGIRKSDGWQETTRRLKAHGGFILRAVNVCQDADEDGDPDCQCHPMDALDGEIWDGLKLWSMAMTAGFNIIATDLVDEEKWATVGTDPMWTIPDEYWGYETESLTDLTGAGTRSAPAATSYRGEVHAFLDRDGGAQYVTWNGTTWAGPYDVSGTPEGIPAVAVHGDDLHLVTWSPLGGRIVWQRFDGAIWSMGENLGAAYGSAALASQGGLLYAIYPGMDGRLTTQAWDGETWSAATSVGTETVAALAAAVLGEEIQVVWSDEDGHLYRTSFNGSDWLTTQNLTQVNGARTHYAPSVVAVDDRLEVAIRAYDKYYPEDDTQITCFSIWGGGEVSGQSYVLGSKTSAGVGLAYHDSECFMILKGESDETVWAQYQTVH